MKKLVLKISIVTAMFVSVPTFGQLANPGDGSGGTGGHDPVGGGAPIGSGLALVLGLGLAYGVKKTFKMNLEEE